MSLSIVPRPYQAACAQALVNSALAGGHPVGMVPTGGGKAFIIALIAKRLSICGDERIVVTVPSRELAEQNEAALHLLFPADEIGVVCASLGRREVDRRILVGTPQSLLGAIDFDPAHVIVDEAHTMALHRGSWFTRLFAALPRGRRTSRIGLTATSFRAAEGAIFGDGAWFTCQPFEISVAEMVAAGYLAPVRYMLPGGRMSVRSVTKLAGDFNQGQLVQANLAQVDTQVEIILDALKDRGKAMVFAVSIEHAEAFRAVFEDQGEKAELIVGAMSGAHRDAAVKAFKTGCSRVAITVAAALTGLDVPDIDLIASCRPTMSPIVHMQSIGRGTRPAAGKANLLVLDFAKNVGRFGPVHSPHFDASGQPLGGVAPWRACRKCRTYNFIENEECSHCGVVRSRTRAVTSADLEFGTIDWRGESRALADLTAREGTCGLPVESIALRAYRSKRDPDSVSCMLSFGLGEEAILRTWCKRFDTRFWREIWSSLLGDDPAPRSLTEAHQRRGELVRPASITIEQDGRFWRVAKISYGDDERAAA